MTEPVTVSVRTLRDAAAIAPYLLGYHPQQSLIVLALRDHQVACAAAAPLPSGGTDFTAQAARMAAVFGDLHADAAVLIGYGPEPDVTAAVEQSEPVLRELGIRPIAAARIAAGRLWHVHCTDPHCPDNDVAFDPSTTATAAAATVAGLVALADRDAVIDQLEPVTGAERDRMDAAFARAGEHLAGLFAAELNNLDGAGAIEVATRQLRALLAEARTAHRRHRRLTDDRAALFIALLALPGLRDLAARRLGGDEGDLDVLLDLTRRADGALVAVPATLLALAALMAGNGTLAGAAVRRALSAAPDDLLANVLALAADGRIPVEHIRQILAD